MEGDKHPYHSIDYEYLRPGNHRIGKKDTQREWTHYKGEAVYRNLYYGTKIPEDQEKKVKEYNNMLVDELKKGNIKPHLPEFWSFHDSWRFADAAAYKPPDMIRDAVNHSPWIEEQKKFNLSKEAADYLASGALYVYGRDKHGHPNIWLDLKVAKTDKQSIEHGKEAMLFQSAVVKKYMLLPYHCELFNVCIDIQNKSVFSLSKDMISSIIGLHQLHWKNSMFKVIIYNPSFTFYALWKVVSLLYNKKYLERVRIIKKGNEKDLWEILDPVQTTERLKGTAPEPTTFWPPVSLEKDPVTIDQIKEQGLMTFDFQGHHADTHFFKKYTPWEEKKEIDPLTGGWFDNTGKLDKTYD